MSETTKCRSSQYRSKVGAPAIGCPAHRDDEILFVEGLLVEAHRDVVGGNDRDIHRAPLQFGKGGPPGALGRRLPLRWKQLTHADVDAGRSPPQLGEKRWQEHGRNAIGSTDREPACGPGGIERPREARI